MLYLSYRITPATIPTCLFEITYVSKYPLPSKAVMAAIVESSTLDIVIALTILPYPSRPRIGSLCTLYIVSIDV